MLLLSLGATFGVDQSGPGHVGYQIWYNVFFSQEDKQISKAMHPLLQNSWQLGISLWMPCQ